MKAKKSVRVQGVLCTEHSVIADRVVPLLQTRYAQLCCVEHCGNNASYHALMKVKEVETKTIREMRRHLSTCGVRSPEEWDRMRKSNAARVRTLYEKHMAEFHPLEVMFE